MVDQFSVHVAEIQWEDVFPDGTKAATLVGSREAGVQFTYAFFIPQESGTRRTVTAPTRMCT